MPPVIEKYSAEKVQSLVSTCVIIVAQNIHQQAESIKLLPAHLKNQILKVVTSRGYFDSKVLECLVHPALRTLDLSECKINDQTLKLISSCTQLRKLDLNPGRNQRRPFSAEALSNLFPSLPYLSILYINQCIAVTDNVIISLAESCPFLKELDIGGCPEVTDIAIKKLSRLRYLSSLNISHSQVSDKGILEFVQGECSNSLTELRLENCLRITDFGIEAIIHHCDNLTEHLVFMVECHFHTGINIGAMYKYDLNRCIEESMKCYLAFRTDRCIKRFQDTESVIRKKRDTELYKLTGPDQGTIRRIMTARPQTSLLQLERETGLPISSCQMAVRCNMDLIRSFALEVQGEAVNMDSVLNRNIICVKVY